MCALNLCFEQKYKKYQNFSAENFQFLTLKKSLFIAWASFRNVLFASLLSMSHRLKNYSLQSFSLFARYMPLKSLLNKVKKNLMPTKCILTSYFGHF